MMKVPLFKINDSLMQYLNIIINEKINGEQNIKLLNKNRSDHVLV